MDPALKRELAESHIRAFPLHKPEDWPIEPAPPTRQWLDNLPHKMGYKCLPLAMGCRYGWFIRTPVTFTVTWNGGPANIDTTIEFADSPDRWTGEIGSHFGSGILTFNIPWLFRTPPGIGMMVRGPSNFFKINAQGLDAVVETDWAPYNFSMNWKIIQPNMPVTFDKGDPICMIIPIQLDLIESLKASVVAQETEPRLIAYMRQFHANRKKVKQQREPGQAMQPEWNYMHGRNPDGTAAPNHRSSLSLARFIDRRNER